MFGRVSVGILSVVLGLGLASPCAAADRELPPGLMVPAAARPGPDFDVERATQAYLDLLSSEQRAQSDAYYEGGYWLELWQLVYGLGVAGLLLFTGLSRRMREAAQRVSARPWLYTAVYVALWVIAMFLLNLPMGAYANFLREHQYGLSNETFGAWLLEDVVELGTELVIIPPIFTLAYVAVRRTGARWWLWTGGLAVASNVAFGLLGPVLIAPLFNRYEPLPPGEAREAILSLARANRIPADAVYVVDSSRQSNTIGGNVSGLFGSTRISLNDTLLRRTSPPEIRLVMAHEMGHYLFKHGFRFLVYISVLLLLGLWILHRSVDGLIARWGRRWGVADRGDPAGLPLAMAILSLFLTVATPLTNSIERQAEAEADAFAINATGEPHAFATAALRLSTSRKLRPTPLEEVIFYDHPSGYDRGQRAMAWLKENPDDPRMLASLAAAAMESCPQSANCPPGIRK